MMSQASLTPLNGCRILVVEDDAIVAMLIEAHVTDFGCQVAGPAGNVPDALQVIEQTLAIDAAILDINLGGTRVDPVAVALAAKGIPFLFLTGYGDQPVDAYPQAPVLGKPFALEQLHKLLHQLLAPDAQPTR